MVLSMSNTNQPHLPQRITVTMKFNFNSIFYVRYKSEEISPGVGVGATRLALCFSTWKPSKVLPDNAVVFHRCCLQNHTN